jgi:hypothetical protein
VQHPREQRPPPAYIRRLAHEAAAFLESDLEDSGLVRAPATWGGTLMDEDEFVVGVDVRLAEGEQLLRTGAAKEWGEHEIPVASVDGIQEPTGFIWRNPATLLPSPHRLKPGVG